MLEIIYAIIAGLSDIFGGWLGLKINAMKSASRYIIGFASGILLTVVFTQMLPEISVQSHAWIIGAGFFTFYIIEKVMMLHACGEGECKIHKIGSVTVFGMALDNVVDGVGIAVGYATSPALGLIITIGVVIHEIPQGIASAVIMKRSGYPRTRTYTMLVIAALLYPVGAFLSTYIPGEFNLLILAFIAGDFLYIGASDLLPEAHKKLSVRVIASVILGLLFVILLSQVFGVI